MNRSCPKRPRMGAAVLVPTVIALAVLSCFLVPSMALADDNYGAIAYSKSSGAYGYSYDFDSRGAAEERALSECRAKGSGCRVVVWYKNACGALATSADGAYGWGWSSSRSSAEARALSECRARGDGCKIRCWSCTSR